MVSARYTQLQLNVKKLRQMLLPAKFDPTGVYTTRVQFRTVAFIVLAHGEIESYLEDVTTSLANDATLKWADTGVANTVALSLLAYFGHNKSGDSYLLPNDPRPSESSEGAKWDNHHTLLRKVSSALSNFEKMSQNNHGIKYGSVLGHLLAVGVQYPDLDPSALTRMNEFGKTRGDIAHQSLTKYLTRKHYDPKSEYDSVRALVADLKAIDELVIALTP